LMGFNNQLSHIEITGEAFDPDLPDRFLKFINKPITFLDCYGATEATSVIYRDFSQIKGNKKTTYLLANTQIHILDSHLNPVPIGTTGEIYIGGAGLARGYLTQLQIFLSKNLKKHHFFNFS